MTGLLDGLTVVVTRPAAQAGHFIELVRRAGAHCIAYPTLQIDRVMLDAPLLSRYRAGHWDWAVFTSANAVDLAFEQLTAPLAERHAAIGPATARALIRHGIHVAAQPAGANSESLLELPEFSGLSGCGVLLVKGSGGRELLRDAVIARGGTVLELEVYRRSPAMPQQAAVAALQAVLAEAQRPLVITATSAESLQSLLQHAPGNLPAALRRQALLVPGRRVAAIAVGLGWTGHVVAAATADDDAMLDALARAAPGWPPAAC